MLIYTLVLFIPAAIKDKGLISTAYLTVRTVYNTVPELMFVQSSGFFESCLNYPVWQINAIIICGYFIYACLYYCEKLSADLLFPVIFILFETYWIIGRDPFTNIGCLPATLTRGVAMMALGVLIYKFSCSELYKTIKSKHIPYNLFSLFMFAGMFVFGRYNGIHIIGMCVSVLYLYNPDSWINCIFNKDIFKFCGDLSYAVYLNHAVVIKIVQQIFGSQNPGNTACIILLLSLTIYSVFTVKIVNILKAYFTRKKSA